MNDESLFERYKNEVRTKLSVRDLVEEAKPKGLRATGASSLICCSPLRADKNPSFSVFKNGGDEYIGFDHATRESFDLYGYIEKKEGLSFAEAVKWAGDRVGMSWDDYKKQNGEGSYAAPPPPGISQAEWDKARDGVLALDERQLVGNVQQAMVDLAHAMFLRSGLPAYVEKRWGISPETQNRFMLGFIPHGFASLLDQLYEQGDFKYGRRKLVKTGWFVERSQVAGDPNPELRCIFDGRLLYPYLFRGKCRYAAARIIYEQDIDPSYFVGREWDQSKFKKAMVNSSSRPSVSPYVQNDILYNADNLLRSRSGFKRIVIVEGPSDCMTMVEQGYDCVAPVTTSVRVEDIPALVDSVKEYEEVVLATDTDITEDGRRPGLEGALRMAPQLLAAKKKVRLLILPLAKGQTKMDPAAWALQWKEQGKTGDPFEKLMATLPSVARGLVNFLDQDITGERLPESLTEIVTYARMADLKPAEMEDLRRDIRKRLKGNFSVRSIQIAMGEVAERIDKADRIVDPDEKKTVPIDGAVTERGGFDDPDRTCGYDTWSKTGGARISNFILQPRRIIHHKDEGGELLEVSIYVDSGTKLRDRWEVPASAWVSKRGFKEAFSGILGMSFSGTEDNIQGIRKLIVERAKAIGVREVETEPIIGIHQTKFGPRLVMPSETWDENGKMEDPDVIYRPDSERPTHPMTAVIQVDGTQDPADVDAMVKRVFEKIFLLNDAVSLTTICAWIVGCYFLPEIRKINGKACILNVYGSPGSAKTTTLHKILNRTLLPFGDKYEPNAPGSKFVSVRSLSWSNMFPSTFDEYRLDSGDKFIDVIRSAFSGITEERGKKDQGLNRYVVFGTVQISGEQNVNVEDAMGERLVMVNFSRTAIEKRKASDVVVEILDEPEKWRVATDILQWRMKLDPAVARQWWDEARKEARETIAEINMLSVEGRKFDRCVEMAFRLRTFREWLAWRGAERVIDVPLASLADVIRRVTELADECEIPTDGSAFVSPNRSLVVRSLEAVTPYAVQGVFEDGKGYRLCIRNERRMLVVHPAVLCTILARETRSRGQSDPTNGLSALRQSAHEEFVRKGDMGWLVNPLFRFRMGSSDEIGVAAEKSSVRAQCWLIDITRAAEQVGLDLNWPGEAATWGGSRKAAPPPGTTAPWKRAGWPQTQIPGTSGTNEGGE